MRRAIAIRSGLSAVLILAACGGGSGGGQMPPAELAEPAASEAVAAAALRAAAALVELASDPAGTETAVAGDCARGALSGTCVTRAGIATLRLAARDCELDDPIAGRRLTVDGKLTISTPFPACDQPIPANGVRTYRFTDFSVAVEDDAGVVERFAAERLTETLRPLGSGCDQSDAVIDVSGRLAVQRRGGIDAALQAADLHLERHGSGSAGACARSIAAAGGLRIEDRGAGRVDEVELDGLTVELDSAGGVRRIDGGLALACAPSITLVTDEALQPGDECPVAGVLTLEHGDGGHGVVRFNGSAVAIDADGDGTPERVDIDCGASLASCS